MLQLPVPSKVGTDFLNGDGHFSLETDKDAWSGLLAGGAFTKDTDPVADVTLGIDSTKDFTFGRADGIKLSVKAGAEFQHQVRILWPQQDDDLAKEYGLTIPADHIYARLLISAKADGAASAGFPVGPLSATVGVAAGGNAKYERWMRVADSAPGLQVLKDLYSGIRLPHSIDEISEIPEPGELLAFRYGGYLKLNAGLSWGYSIAGTKSLEAGKMDLDLDYQLRLMAAVNFGYHIAGDYQIEARRGSDPEWVRFVVRKSRDSETTLAGDFGFSSDWELKGLPASADEFIAKLLGAHAEAILDVFGKARRYSNLKELQTAAGKLLNQTIKEYSDQVLGLVLNDETVQQVIKRMQQVAGAYANLDKRIVDLYHDVVKEIPGQQNILKAINTVLGAATKEDLATLSGTGQFAGAIDLLRRVYNDRLFEVLQKNEAFAEATSLLTEAKAFIQGTGDPEIKKWIDMIQANIPVDGLLKQLAGLTPDQIKAIADEKLQGLVEKLVGKAFDQLEKSDFAKVAALVNNNLEKIETFKNTWYKKGVEKAAKGSFEMNLHLAYSRARKNERLLDVEINLAAKDAAGQFIGKKLARAAAAGDYEQLLQTYDPGVVRILQGVFSTQLRNSLAVKFNVLGYGSDGIVALVQEAQHAIDPRDGGLLHVYTSNTYIERKKTSGGKFKESVDSKFLVQAVGESFQLSGTSFRPYAIDVLRSLTASYDLLQTDDQTTAAELSEYLRLAQSLNLVEDSTKYVNQLVAACDGDLGKVSLTYRMAFDAVSIRSAFHFSGASGDPDGGTLGGLARQAMREFLMRKFASQPATNWFPRIAFAYAGSSTAYQWYRQGALTAKLKSIILPSWYTGGAPEEKALTAEMVSLVDRMFRFEDEMVKALLDVDAQVDSATTGNTVDFEKLNGAVLKMTKAAGDVGQYDTSCFPVILDWLIKAGSGGAAKRDSTVLIEVAPSKGKLAGQKLTRMLASGPKNPAEIAVDAQPANVSAAAGQ